jgi:hypothetical protein
MVALPQVATSTASLGTARLPQAVMADGTVLPAGTYQVRLTTDAPAPVVGQTPAAARWVEFLRNGTVVGREVATVVSADDMRTMAKLPRGTGAVRVQTLKGGDYVRVWVLNGGAHILIHLPAATR